MNLDERARGDAGSELTYLDYFGAIGTDILNLARIVWHERRVFWIFLVLTLIIGLKLALFSDPVFQAQTLLEPRAPSESSGLGGVLSGRLGSVSSLIGLSGDKLGEELMASLKSRSLIYAFIKRFDLERALYPELWDAQAKRWRPVYPGIASRTLHTLNGTPVPKVHFGPTLEQTYQTLLRKLDVSEDAKSGLITVSFEWGDPVQAAQWTNGLIVMLNDVRRQEAIASSQSRIRSLQSQLQTTVSVEMRQVLVNLMQSETENIAIAQSEQQYAMRVLDPAVPTDNPVWPRRGLIMFLSAALGCLVGSISALMWSVMKRWPVFDWMRERRAHRGISGQNAVASR